MSITTQAKTSWLQLRGPNDNRVKIRHRSLLNIFLCESWNVMHINGASFWPQMTCILRILTFQETKTTISNWHTNNEVGRLWEMPVSTRNKNHLFLLPREKDTCLRLFFLFKATWLLMPFSSCLFLHSLLLSPSSSASSSNLCRHPRMTSPHGDSLSRSWKTALLGIELWAH